MAKKLDPAQAAGGEAVCVEDDDRSSSPASRPPGSCRATTRIGSLLGSAAPGMSGCSGIPRRGRPAPVAGGDRGGAHATSCRASSAGDRTRASHLPRGSSMRCPTARPASPPNTPGSRRAGVSRCRRSWTCATRPGIGSSGPPRPERHAYLTALLRALSPDERAEAGALAREQGMSAPPNETVEMRRRRIGRPDLLRVSGMPLPRGGGHPPHFPRMNAYRSA